MATADDYANWIVKNADKKGTPEFDTVAKAYQEAKAGGATEIKPMVEDKGALQNVALGALRGATNIGTTLLTPVDWAYDKVTGNKGTNDWRKKQLSDFYNENANTDSYSFKGGELATEIAGTSGVGGVLAKGVRAVPSLMNAAPKLATALETGGFKIGGAPATTAKEMAKNVGTRLAGGAVTGGVSAGMVNPDDAGVGAGIGAAMPVVGKVAYDAGKATKAALIDPIINQDMLVRRAIANAVGEDAMPGVIARLGQQATTPGVRFSAAQSTQNPSLAAFEDAFKATNPGGVLNAQDVANRQVMADRMRGVAGSESDIASAVSDRGGAANVLYGKAFASDAQRRDVADSAMQYARSMMGTGVADPGNLLSSKALESLRSRPAFSSAVSKAQEMIQNQTGSKVNPLNSLEGLHYIKLALDDMSNPKAATALGKNESRAVESLKEELSKELENISPLYQNARQVFADMSTPINRMQVGTVLRDKFIPATSGDLPASLNAASLASELRKADAVAQRATGMKGLTFDKIMGDQAPVVRGVSDDASRIAETTKLGMGVGSPTARRQSVSNFIGDNLANRAPLTSSIIGALGNVPVLNYGTKMLGSAGNMLGERLNARMAGKLEEALASNPKEIERALLEAKRNKVRGLLSEQYSDPMIRSAIIQGGLLSAQ